MIRLDLNPYLIRELKPLISLNGFLSFLYIRKYTARYSYLKLSYQRTYVSFPKRCAEFSFELADAKVCFLFFNVKKKLNYFSKIIIQET